MATDGYNKVKQFISKIANIAELEVVEIFL